MASTRRGALSRGRRCSRAPGDRRARACGPPPLSAPRTGGGVVRGRSPGSRRRGSRASAITRPSPARRPDANRQTWRIPMQRAKTQKTRHVPLSDAAMQVLAQVPRFEGCPYVIPNPATMEPYHSVFHAWDKARKAAGLPDVRMHDLRHSAASNLVNSGQSLYVVGSILGHAQAKTTARYAHLANETLLAAANAAAGHMGTDWARKTG